MGTGHFVVYLVCCIALLAGAVLLGSRRALRLVASLSILGGVFVLASVGAHVQKEAGPAGAGEKRRITSLVVDGGQEVVNDTVGRLLPGDVGLDVVAGLALLLAAVGAYRWAEIANSRRTPGPVAIRPFRRADGSGGEGDGGGAPEELGSIEARFRQNLADANVLPPPSVPGGSDQQELVDVVQQTPLVDASGLAKVLAVAAKMALPKTGYAVTATVVSDADTGGQGLVVTLTEVRTSSTVAVRTFLDESCEKAADKASYFVSQQLLARCATVPPWQRWWDYRSLEAYQLGRRALEYQDWAQARSAFSEACVNSPNNIHPALELAAVHVLEGHHDEGLMRYLSVLRRHPRLVEARYRLAVTYGMAESWYPPPRRDRDYQERLQRLFEEQHRHCGHESPLDADDDKEAFRRFYLLALEEYERLKKDLRRLTFATWSVRSAHRWLIGPEPLLASSPKVLNGPRVPMLRTVEVACLIARLKLGMLDCPQGERQPARLAAGPLVPELERVLARRRVGWQARYNAACFYAAQVAAPPAGTGEGRRRAWETENDELASRAVTLLSEVFLDPENEFTADPAWILEKDGDLINLRKHSRFADWKREMGLEERASMRRAELDERDGLSTAWSRLALVADGLRLVGPAPSPDLDAAPTSLGVREQRLWEALATWARRPLDEERWVDFRGLAEKEQPALCDLALDAEPACPPDYRDPAEVASRQRASWRKLARAAAQLAPVWGARQEQPVGNGNQHNGRSQDWLGEARSLWESLSRWSRQPLSQPLQEEFEALAMAVTAGDAEPAAARREEAATTGE